MKTNTTFVILLGALILTACDNGFLGNNNSFKGGGTKEGSQIPKYPPGGQPPGGQPQGSTDTSTETDFIGGGGFGDAVFWNAQLFVERADGAESSAYNHKDIEIELTAGSGSNVKTTGKVAVGSKGHSATLENVCTSGSAVQFEFAVYHQGTKISPNKSAGRGGIIAYRLSPDAILIGYEKSAVGHPTELAWHQNDDWIARISCDPSENGDLVQIKMKNTCFDQRIPNNGQNFLGKNDDADSPKNRVCSGEN